MPAGYDYSDDRLAVATLTGCTPREQRMLLEAFEGLARSPSMHGDYSFSDGAGRVNEVLDLGDFVVTYWTDHAVQVVRVLPVDRV